MKFCEAVLLGSTVLRPIPHVRRNNNGGGCALGMAEAASGSALAEFTWPWLKTSPDKYPCGCLLFMPGFENILLPWNYAVVVAHIFNEHVCKDKTWTLEQLVDYIKSVEPEEQVFKVTFIEQKAEKEAVSV